MISHQHAFRSFSKCSNPLRFPRFCVIHVPNHQVWSALSTVPPIRNVSSNASNASDARIKSNTTPKPKLSGIGSEPLGLGTKLIGQSGMQYRIDGMLQHRTDPVLACVYLATAEDQKKYAIKNIFSTEFEYQLDLQAPLRGCPNLRVVIDTVPEHLLFVYNYCTTHLLKLAEKDNLSDASRKRILRDTLAGIADLHERNILHGDIKPDNIFVNYEESPNGAIEVQRVQVGDLEMGSVIPPGLNVRGAKLGNPMWRSPESHATARINLPTDVFSFGLVCIYTMLRKVIFRIESEGLSRADEERLVVKRLLSNFGDGPGLVGLIDHLDDSVASWRDLVLDVTPEFTATNPRKPFSMWVEVDEGFRDIVTKMTSLDPARRITAREALEHPWFHDL